MLAIKLNYTFQHSCHFEFFFDCSLVECLLQSENLFEQTLLAIGTNIGHVPDPNEQIRFAPIDYVKYVMPAIVLGVPVVAAAECEAVESLDVMPVPFRNVVAKIIGQKKGKEN